MSQETTLTAAHLADGVAAGDLSAGELLTAALELGRTEGRRLNAFITLCEEKALRQAQQIDRKVKAGEPVGPLAGVPVAIKDNICYSDYPTTCASRILERFVPPYDATVVTKLIDAGVIIIGKTNLDEFAMGSSSETSYYGPAKSPVGDDLVPGGSSGGSAAAVAAGIVPIALGSDTGGSIRQPAAFCGIYGLKPTYGAVSRYGLVAYGSSLDQIGPFARDVKDLALAYKVIAGHDSKDSTSIPYEHPDYPELLESERQFTIGVPKEFFTEGLDPEVDACVKRAIDDLKGNGHTLVDISLPLTDRAIATYYTIVTAEASSNLARYDGVRYGLRESGDRDLATMYTDTRTAGFGPEVKRRIMLGTFVLSSGYYDQYYVKASKVRELFRRDFAKAFGQVDLIISPTAPTPAFRFGEKLDDPLTMYLSDAYTLSANLVGIPAISVPYTKASDGRPVGIQFMAPHFGELLLFRIAFVLERFS